MKKLTLFIISVVLITFSSCEKEEDNILGCMNSEALNYNVSANVDDGSCIIYGCMDETATNFNPNANLDDNGSCEYPISWAGTYDASEDCNNGWQWEQVITENGNQITLVDAFDWGNDITLPFSGNTFSATNIDGFIISTDANGVETEIQVVYTVISGEIDGDVITMQYNMSQLDENGELFETSDCQPEMTLSNGGLTSPTNRKSLY